MSFGPLDFALGVLLASAVLVWIRHRRSHELALGHVRRFCQTNGLQLLDSTVAFRGFRLDIRPLLLCRSYRFDYSIDRVGRHSGQLTLCADQVESFRIDPEHLAATEVTTVHQLAE